MNIIVDVDSYKVGMYKQYPKGTEYVSSYIEARGSKDSDYDESVFFGLRYYLKEYLSKPITMDNILEAEELFGMHGEPFNKEGWIYILNKYGGYLPLKVEAVREGTIMPLSNVLVQITNTDPECWWLPTWIETSMLRTIWYATTVATNSYTIKKLLQNYYVKSGSVDGLDFKLHDFGARGVSSKESSGIGGLAHLINFKGTDTVMATVFGRKYYDVEMAGFSIPASEHSTITTWKDEEDAIENMLDAYPEYPMIACVADSYNIYKAVHFIGTKLKAKIIKSGKTFIVRPDCYDSKTEILTNNGWKLFIDLAKEDLVAQVGDNFEIDFVKPTRYINQKYTGEMISFSSIKFKREIVVTPNHRMVRSNKNNKLNVIDAENAKYYYNQNLPVAGLKTTGKDTLTPEEQFLISFQADGRCRTMEQTSNPGILGGSFIAEFTFSKDRKIARMLDILNKCNYKYKITDRIYENKDWKDAKIFYVYLDFNPAKTLNWVNIQDISSIYAISFIDEIAQWDGTTRDNDRIKFDNTSKFDVEVVQQIATLAGYKTTFSEYNDDRSINYNIVYTLHIDKKLKTLGGSSIKKEIINYSGTVHCVTVPSGMLLLRRNMQTFISGNSGDPKVVPIEIIEQLMGYFGYKTNEKGYKTLPQCIRVIQGDGITKDSIKEILVELDKHKLSLDNIAFGMGSGMLQQVNRDTLGFAMKASNITIKGENSDVFKNPVHGGKVSKKGILALYKSDAGEYRTDRKHFDEERNVLGLVYLNGSIVRAETFDEIVKRAEI